MTWIQTYRGCIFTPLDPQPEQIEIEDIAHALSMNCRFNGHTKEFYSVAEHCVIASLQVPEEAALAVLLHDAAEAYVSDIAKPLKPHLTNYQEIEDRIQDVICRKYKVPVTAQIREQINQADLRMLKTEQLQFFPKQSAAWNIPSEVQPFDIDLPCWNPEQAKKQFLRMFIKLQLLDEEKEVSHVHNF